MSRKGSFAANRLSFDNFYHLIDALMLFGGSIEPGRDDSCEYRLQLRRASPQAWPAMVWAIIVAESQDPDFDFMIFKCGSVGSNDSLTMTTRFSKFLKPAYDNWYQSGLLRIPGTLELNERHMIYWLVGSLCRWSGAGALTLQGPEVYYNPAGLAKSASQALGLDVAVSRDRRLFIGDTDKALAWLEESVPATVWR